MGLNMFLIP